jgi:hypothetical protein
MTGVSGSHRLGLLALVGAALLATGCGSTLSEPVAQNVPDPPLARVLPADYHVNHLWRHNLTGAEVPDAIVTATGPSKGELGFHPMTLLVVSWDALAKRWNTTFDAQKVIAPAYSGSPQTTNNGPGIHSFGPGKKTPLLDPQADVGIDNVAFGSLLGGRDQLVFSATMSYGGSGVPGRLTVVDFPKGDAHIAYDWYGEGLSSFWLITSDQIDATANYWTPADSHCCPSRRYDFAVAGKDGHLTEIRDERPYLGALVRETDENLGPFGPLKVIELPDDSPAMGVLEVGDAILDVTNANTQAGPDDFPASSIFGKLTTFDAGDTAKLLVSRRDAQVIVPVRLGSLKDADSMTLPEGDDSVSAL